MWCFLDIWDIQKRVQHVGIDLVIPLMAEIRRSPVEVKVVEIPFFTRFQEHPRWLGMGFLNHQQ